MASEERRSARRGMSYVLGVCLVSGRTAVADEKPGGKAGVPKKAGEEGRKAGFPEAMGSAEIEK